MLGMVVEQLARWVGVPGWVGKVSKTLRIARWVSGWDP